ncbi:MAG: DNA polymerase III subunit alpha [PS1 clade bacterium]
MPMTEFVHLQCQTEYSVKNSLVRIEGLIDQAIKLGYKSVALTDDSNIFAAIKFYKKCIEAGVKPIIGTNIRIKDGDKYSNAILLCQNNEGYLNLSQLITHCYLHEQDIDGVSATKEQIIKHQEGLIMLSTPVTSDIAKLLISNQVDEAKKQSKFWQSIFGDRFYLSVQRTGRPFDEQLLHMCVDLSIELDLALVATNDVQFILEGDYEAHEARICISEGGLLDDSRREKLFSSEQYLKSNKQMEDLFSDLPELLTNSVEISKRCNVHFDLYKKNYLPDFPVPDGLTINQYFRQQSESGLDKRLLRIDADRDTYKERLDFEISVIIQMDYPGYFLIVADFISWAKDNDIPVGPGRGSGAGSLVAYALGITNVDPIEHELLFERFLNPERVSMPDFDIDFCTDRRDEVIDYVSRKYGAEKVSQIITYGTMAAKGVVRDVGRVLGHPYGFSDRISKSIPNDLKINLSRALGNFEKKDSQESKDKWYSEELKNRYDSEESVTTLIDLSLQLEGLVRNVGTHAGGVLIAPSKISDFCPVYKGPGDEDVVVSQFDMKDVEAMGLVKFDFLGLSNLTVIDKTVKMISSTGLSKEAIDMDSLPLDDNLVYELLQRCETTGIFQLESDGMRGYLKKLLPDTFEDIVAMLALYRPGPLGAGMVDDYINVKHGAKVKYPHKMLEDILKPTNGVFLYQEQVMKSAQVMAGYSLGGADLLRRAMGKKIAEEMQEQRSVFVNGAGKNNINEKKANEIFDLIDKFSGYGFNKSHSVAYAYISYQTAWLKAHYPSAFMASVLSGVMDDTDRVAFTIDETDSMGLKVRGPNINESDFEFSIKDDKTIIYGLGAIKGVGEALVEALVGERSLNGKYKDLFDFCYRIDRKSLNKRAIEALIYSGSLDCFGVERSSLVKTYPYSFRQAEQQQKDSNNGQSGLFSNVDHHRDYEANYISSPILSFKERIKHEKSVMGFYFYSHPTDEYLGDVKHIAATMPTKLVFRNNKDVRVLAMISDLRYRSTRGGGQMVNVIVEDKSTKLNAVIFNKVLGSVSDQLLVDNVVLIKGKVNKDYRDQWQLVIDELHPVDEVKVKYAKYLELKLNKDHKKVFSKLSDILVSNKGSCPVKINYRSSSSKGLIELGKEYYVLPTQNLIDEVDNLLGEKLSSIKYYK